MSKLLYFALLGAILGLCGIAAPKISQAAIDEKDSGPASMDGVWLEAVENYPAVRKNSLDFGIGIYPYDPYYNAFAFSVSYSHAFSRSLSWEALGFTYLYTVQKGLREELADNFGVNPTTIERPNFILSSNLFFMQV